MRTYNETKYEMIQKNSKSAAIAVSTTFNRRSKLNTQNKILLFKLPLRPINQSNIRLSMFTSSLQPYVQSLQEKVLSSSKQNLESR